MDLLHEKAVREIAVTDICELAQIDRSTFHAHYDDLTALSKSFSEKAEKLLLSQPRTDENYAWLFAYMKEHPQIFNAYFKLGINEIQADYKTLFLRSAVHAVAKLWFESGCVESVEKMGTLILREMKRPSRPGRKFCVSDFRQSQEWCPGSARS